MRMMSEISVHEFREWRAYYDLEPFGEERQDLRIGSLVATILNIARKRGKPPISVRDGTIKVGEPVARKAKPWQTLKAIGASIAGAFRKDK